LTNSKLFFRLSASLHEAQTSSVPAAIVEENLKQFKLQLQMSEEKQLNGLKVRRLINYLRDIEQSLPT
jgi:hypothetical protein